MGYYFGATMFTLSICAAVYFARGAIRAYQSPEFKRDMERLREQRRLRKSARRNS